MAPAKAAGDRAPARTQAADRLERGRRCYAERAWLQAYTALSQADQAAPLGAEDLELLATAAGMLGRDDDYLSLLERAHHAFLDAGEPLRAARCAFWVGTYSAIRGQVARATGWLGRAQRLVEREERDCVEQGYLLVTAIMEQEAAGDYEAAYATTVKGAAIGERFGDADLVALALHDQGRILAKQGRIEDGLGLLDEVMVAVSTGELSPIVTGLLYCSVIEGCQQVFELRRAREWTAALTQWCAEQPEMVSFTGRCLVHRAEIMQVDGAWPDALEEARRAGERFAQVQHQVAVGESFYRQGEIHRLRGERGAAEEAYREASRLGWEPQPGLALLRLAQGDNDAAVGAIRRVAAETTDPLKRAGLLPAYVEIMLAVGELEEARSACRELEEITAGYRSGMLSAMVGACPGCGRPGRRRRLGRPRRAPARVPGVAGARGAVRGCARTRPRRARLPAARRRGRRGDGARRGAPRLPGARRRAGPRAGGEARPDGGAQDGRRADRARAGGAPPGRNRQTNRAIADDLVISEKTVARHVSNIFTKLRVSSRSAVTAYAYEHDLV